MEDQIENYRRKVQFLKQASFARSCLEESAAMSSSAASMSATVAAAAAAAAATEDKGGTPDNLVRSAQTLLRALQEVDKAEQILKDSAIDQQKEIEVAHRILSSLRHQIRRHRVELVHKAGTVLDGSVELTSTSIAVKSSPQLDIAYRVLETLDDGAIGNRQTSKKHKNSALQETLRGFTTRLYREALKPILTKQLSDKNDNGDGARRWKVEETADKRSTTIIGVSASNKRGTMHLIEWSFAHAASGDENDNDNDNDNEISAIPEEESKTFSFAVVNSWKNVLDVVQRILVFVQSKVLLEREALCSMVGKRLFGTPNAMPSLMNLSALGLESTLLGENDQGVLVEAMLEWLRKQCLSESDGEDTMGSVGSKKIGSSFRFARRVVGVYSSLLSRARGSTSSPIGFSIQLGAVLSEL